MIQSNARQWETSEQVMAHALALAERGRYTTAPNPRVGCVIARQNPDGSFIGVGEGYHSRAGEAHAEVLALREAGSAARGATAFVTLEPCAHFGRTPPCTEALVNAGIAKVIVATTDPNALVSGKGLAQLRQAGIETDVGLLEVQSRWLNRGFMARHLHGRPWVILKIAISLDGRLATWRGDSQWITGPESRGVVHRMRAEADAVMVGAGTLRTDNPLLTPRDIALDVVPVPTTRIVVAGAKPLPQNPRLLESSDPILILTNHSESVPPWPRTEIITVPVDDADSGRIQLRESFQRLADRSIGLVLVEGGSTLATALLEADSVDEIAAFIAPVLIGGKDAPNFWEGRGVEWMREAKRLHPIEWRSLGDDLLFHGVLRDPSTLGLTASIWPLSLTGLPMAPAKL